MKIFITTILLTFCIAISNYAQFGSPIRISKNAEDFESPESVIPADMDNDGDMDLVGATVFNGNIIWYENLDGQGNMSDPIVIANFGFANPNGYRLSDIDKDGDIDVLVQEDGAIFLITNTIRKSANFSAPINIGDTPSNSGVFHIDDLDNDGHLDIVVTGSATAGWLQGNNNSNFETFEELVNTGGEFGLADIDNDNQSDIILGNSNGIRLFKNIDNASSFSSEISVSNAQGSNYQFADLDGDGDVDIVSSSFEVSVQKIYLRWHENLEGNGNSWVTHIIEDSTGAAGFTLFDFDSDGDTDLATTQGGRVSVYQNQDGEGNFEVHNFPFSMLSRPNYVAHADMNNDSLLDFVAVVRSGTGGIDQGVILMNKGNNAFANPIEFLSDADQILAYEGMLTSNDIDNDGKAELFTGHNNYGRIGWQRYDFTKQKFTNSKILEGFRVFSTIDHLNFSDLDGDGDDDIIAINDTGSGDDELVWYENLDGEDNYGPKHVLFQEHQSLEFAQGGDFDGDGDNDIFFSKPGADQSGIYWFENLDGAGSFSTGQQVDAATSNSAYSTAILADIDTDGDLDILVNDSWPSGMNWYENENGTFGSLELLFDAPLVANLQFEDLDGDGWKDIVYVSNNSILSWHKSIGGTGQFEDAEAIAAFNVFSVFDNAIHIKDINLDGNKDIIVLNNFGEIFLVENNGSIFSSPKLIPGTPPQITRINLNDYDGDKDEDLVLFVNNTNTMYIMENFLDQPSLTSRVFLDKNENQFFDGDEYILYDQFITVQPEAVAALPSSSGEFYFALDNGEHDVTCLSFENFSFTTPLSYQINVTENSSFDVEFGLNALLETPEVIGHLTSGPTRCGFTVPFWLDYQNTGTVNGDVSVSLFIDTLTTFIESDPMPDSIVGNHIYWTFTNLPPSHSGQIQLTFEIAGVDFLEEWISMQVITNILDQNGEMDNHQYGYRSQINCSVDPNDKLVEPDLPGDDNFILFGDTLDYTIRFQNTGTDTAFTVRVEDFLDANLDWTTLKVIGSSHPYEAKLDQRSGRLLFTFEDILLPDSSTNLIESNGYIRFKIKHKEDLPEYTYVENSAGIYFDFNPPIFTNTVENIFVTQYPLEVVIQTPACHGDTTGSIEIDFEYPFYSGYQWETGSTNNFIDSLVAGEYSLTVLISNGRTIDTTFQIQESNPFNPTITSTPETDDNMDGSIIIETTTGVPPFTFQWSSDSMETSNILQGISAGEYQVTITDSDECSQILTVVVDQTTSLNKIDNSINFEIFPNPSRGLLNMVFDFPSVKKWELKINNILGQEIQKYNSPYDGSSSGEILVDLPIGIYFITLAVEENLISSEKVIIQR